MTHISNPPHQILLQERHHVGRRDAGQLAVLDVIQQDGRDGRGAGDAQALVGLQGAVVARLLGRGEDVRDAGERGLGGPGERAGALVVDLGGGGGADKKVYGEGAVKGVPVAGAMSVNTNRELCLCVIVKTIWVTCRRRGNCDRAGVYLVLVGG